jgi:predicted sulfurtransferase
MQEKILLYYKYVTIENPQQISKWVKTVCESLSLKGRIIVAKEGINGTLGGAVESIDAFKTELLAHPLFANTDMKESEGGAEHFPRLSVKVRTEITVLGINPDELTVKDGGTHLSPDQVHEIISAKKDLVILDTRNNYESRIGQFKNAIIPPIKTFRELPSYIDENEELFKDKEVLMYCTGGVRCERATAYLNKKNIAKEVYQIDGGICRYVEKYPDGHFRGKNYVFDDRIAVPVNNDVLTHCDLCKAKSDTYSNCMNACCNAHFIACEQCNTQYNSTCSTQCRDLVASGKVQKRKRAVGTGH